MVLDSPLQVLYRNYKTGFKHPCRLEGLKNGNFNEFVSKNEKIGIQSSQNESPNAPNTVTKDRDGKVCIFCRNGDVGTNKWLVMDQNVEF